MMNQELLGRARALEADYWRKASNDNVDGYLSNELLRLVKQRDINVLSYPSWLWVVTENWLTRRASDAPWIRGGKILVGILCHLLWQTNPTLGWEATLEHLHSLIEWSARYIDFVLPDEAAAA